MKGLLLLLTLLIGLPSGPPGPARPGAPGDPGCSPGGLPAPAPPGGRVVLQRALPESARADSLPAPAAPGGAVLVDDADARHVEITAYWARASSDETHGGCGPTILHDGGVGADGVVRFQPPLETGGRYEVLLYWPAFRSEARPLASRVPVTVRHAGGTASLRIDQRTHAGAWFSLGTFTLEPGRAAYVEIRNDEADGYVVADAALFRPVP